MCHNKHDIYLKGVEALRKVLKLPTGNQGCVSIMGNDLLSKTNIMMLVLVLRTLHFGEQMYLIMVIEINQVYQEV